MHALSQLRLQNFPHRVARDDVKVLNMLGQLVDRHANLFQVVNDIFQRRQPGLVLGHDVDTGLLAHDFVGHRHRCYLLHTGVGEYQVLDLCGAYIETTTNDDVLLAVKKADVAFIAHDEKITGAKETVGRERILREGWPPVVAGKHVGSAIDQLAHLAWPRAFLVLLVKQLGLYASMLQREGGAEPVAIERMDDKSRLSTLGSLRIMFRIAGTRIVN